MSCNCTSTAPIQSCASDTTGLERVNYFPRQIMTVEDMDTEADYFREKLRRHNRYLHGWGVVCGLDVTPDPTAPATVSISGGYALGPYGDEIYVAEPVSLDLSRCIQGAMTDPCEPGLPLRGSNGSGVVGTVYVAIRYSECLAKPVRAMPAGCACEEEDCEYSRVRDSFEISCFGEWPQDPKPNMCEVLNKPVPCPPLPTTSWVVLAQVNLPVGGKMMIDPTVRRQLFSTSQIQTPVIDCCCGKTANLSIKKVSARLVQQNLTLRLPNDAIQYTITISNNGSVTAKGVILTDAPVGDIQGSSDFQGLWTSGQNGSGPFTADLGDIRGGESQTLRYILVVKADAKITNTVSIKSQSPISGDTTITHTDPA